MSMIHGLNSTEEGSHRRGLRTALTLATAAFFIIAACTTGYRIGYNAGLSNQNVTAPAPTAHEVSETIWVNQAGDVTRWESIGAVQYWAGFSASDIAVKPATSQRQTVARTIVSTTGVNGNNESASTTLQWVMADSVSPSYIAMAFNSLGLSQTEAVNLLAQRGALGTVENTAQVTLDSVELPTPVYEVTAAASSSDPEVAQAWRNGLSATEAAQQSGIAGSKFEYSFACNSAELQLVNAEALAASVRQALSKELNTLGVVEVAPTDTLTIASDEPCALIAIDDNGNNPPNDH